MAVEGGLGVASAEVVEEGCDGGTLLGGQGVGRDKLCRE